MANIFINGLKAKTGGGKSILNNFLGLLKDSNSTDSYFVLTPDKCEYQKYGCEFVQIVEIGRLFKNNTLFPLLYYVVIPRFFRTYNIDIILNLGDIIIPVSIPQIYLFDWPYAVYPDSTVWKRLDIKSLITRRVKLFLFKRLINYATLVIAQTKTMKTRLESIYGLKNVEVVPNAVSLENMSGGSPFDFDLPKEKTKLLYLTYYYPHKNIEIFLSLARKIKERSLPYCIVITINKSQHKKAKHFLDAVKSERLEDIIVNVGPVEMEHVPSIYAQTDALLMPTLLESFSGTYVEAMFHKKTIFTSNLDFAVDVCGDAAFYFDPFDSDSILNSIIFAFENNDLRIGKIENGKKQLGQLLSWKQVFDKYQKIFEHKSKKVSHA